MTSPNLARTAALVITVASTLLALAGCSTGSDGDRSRAGSDSDLGMMGGDTGYRTSTSTCEAPTSLPGAGVRVSLVDMGMTRMMGGGAPAGARMGLMTSTATVPSGEVSFLAVNRGWRTHELVVLPLAAGAVEGARPVGADGRVSEDGSLGEASGSCEPDGGEGIASGSAGWTTITLPPGRYELVCNLRNHYADGMHATLVVS